MHCMKRLKFVRNMGLLNKKIKDNNPLDTTLPGVRRVVSIGSPEELEYFWSHLYILTAVKWLRYCLNSVKYQSINQSIKNAKRNLGVNQLFTIGIWWHNASGLPCIFGHLLMYADLEAIWYMLMCRRAGVYRRKTENRGQQHCGTNVICW